MAPVDAVGQLAKRVGRRSVDHVHSHHHQRHQRHGNATFVGPQYQKGLAKARQAKQRAHRHHRPIRRAQAAQIVALNGVAARHAHQARGLVHRQHDQQYRQQRGHGGHPKHQAKVIGPQQHEPCGQQRPEHRAHGVERLAQAKSGATNGRWCDVRHQRVTRCVTHALAHPVHKARGQHHGDR